MDQPCFHNYQKDALNTLEIRWHFKFLLRLQELEYETKDAVATTYSAVLCSKQVIDYVSIHSQFEPEELYLYWFLLATASF